jgi:Beta-1,4-N-acetylgalactosaminyltransferase (CgtA)
VSDADFSAFRFDRASLGRPRPPGISAIMRIKNGEEFLRLSIESHLPYVDEVVACYNDCSDGSVAILERLAQEHPGKVRPIEYLPKVHPILSAEHAETSRESIHSIANYYNYALSQARFNYATKLDDDHLAIDVHMKPAIQQVQAAIAANRQALFTFSGLNLAYNQEEQLGVFTHQPFVGTGDHLFFPVCERIYFVQDSRTEVFHFEAPRMPKQYVGLLYFHLKHCKPGAGFHNLGPQAMAEAKARYGRDFGWMAFNAFSRDENLQQLRRSVNPVEYWLRSQSWIDGTIQRMLGRTAPLKFARLARLESDLRAIDFQSAAADRIPVRH